MNNFLDAEEQLPAAGATLKMRRESVFHLCKSVAEFSGQLQLNCGERVRV